MAYSEPKSAAEKWQKDHAVYTQVVVSASKKLPEKWQKPAALVAPALAAVAVVVSVIGPLYYAAGVKLYELYHVLPANVLAALYGFALCFLGGMFPTLIAAVECFKISGWDSTYPHLVELWRHHKALAAANLEDDKKDDDRDGIADVKQITPEQLVQRKTLLFLRVADPEKVNAALGGVYMACLGVVAALKIKFAKTILLSISIANVVRKPAVKLLLPVFQQVVPPEYHKWIITGIDYSCKLVAMSLAWWIQRIVSAVHSAMRGGHMCATYAMRFAKQRGMIQIDPESSRMDEVVGWILAALGLYVQVTFRFSLPFPLNIIFFPLSAVNFMIEWAITD